MYSFIIHQEIAFLFLRRYTFIIVSSYKEERHWQTCWLYICSYIILEVASQPLLFQRRYTFIIVSSFREERYWHTCWLYLCSYIILEVALLFPRRYTFMIVLSYSEERYWHTCWFVHVCRCIFLSFKKLLFYFQGDTLSWLSRVTRRRDTDTHVDCVSVLISF